MVAMRPVRANLGTDDLCTKRLFCQDRIEFGAARVIAKTWKPGVQKFWPAPSLGRWASGSDRRTSAGPGLALMRLSQQRVLWLRPPEFWRIDL